MIATAIYLGGAPDAPLAHRSLRFPLTCIVLALVFFMLPFLLIQADAMHFFEEKLHLRLGQFFGVCVGCLSVAFYVIKIEKRAVFELALKGAWQAYGAGFTVPLAFCRASTARPPQHVRLPTTSHVTTTRQPSKTFPTSTAWWR